MGASYPTKLILAMRSGNRCAFPGCPRELTVNSPGGNAPVSTGQAAHIRGEQPGTARYDAYMTDDERNGYSNLIYLCSDHHTQIDKQESDFSVDRLFTIKTEHETKVRGAMVAAFADVAFPELQEATAWIKSVPVDAVTQDYRVLDLDAKIRKNDLSATSRLTITMGLSIAPLVHQFVENESMLDSGYSDRLKSGFLSEYHRLRHDGLHGDDLFETMCVFAQQGVRDQAGRSAAVAVLVYLFERCEVFEK
ncbi:MAG TPA: HNH endonuclease [Verrucomicrobia bacterium]|nr:HNH endonuclease [Verrucomicrobiota bacterium]